MTIYGSSIGDIDLSSVREFPIAHTTRCFLSPAKLTVGIDSKLHLFAYVAGSDMAGTCE